MILTETRGTLRRRFGSFLLEAEPGLGCLSSDLAGCTLGEGLVLPPESVILDLELLEAFVAQAAQVLDRPCSSFCPRLH